MSGVGEKDKGRKWAVFQMGNFHRARMSCWPLPHGRALSGSATCGCGESSGVAGALQARCEWFFRACLR